MRPLRRAQGVWYNDGMNLWATIRGLFGNAGGIRDNADVEREGNGSGIHTFPARRERALSDIRCVRMLAEAQTSEPGGTSDRGSCNPVRELNPKYGELVSKRTGESAVYWNAAENAYYKVKDPAAKAPLKRTSESDWMYEHVIHNILFPDTAYEFVGVIREMGGVRFVLKQKGISSETFPTDEEVAEYLNRELGLKPEDRYWFGNELLSATDVGAKGDNVLKGDDGRLYFIDPLIRLKRPALEVIEGLIGPVKS